METTNPINGDNIQAVADNLIMETPDNSSEDMSEVVDAILDTETETPEEVYEAQDDDVPSDDVEFTDGEDVEVEEPEVGPELYTVKIDGENREVTLDELKRGYSGQKYIQKGMSEVAETRKEYDQLMKETAQERQVLNQLMQAMQQGNVPVIPEYPSAELQESDPVGFGIQAENYRRAVEQRQQWEAQVKYVQEREQTEKARLHQENLSQQAMRLAEWMPDFADEQKRATIIQDMTAKAKKHYQLSEEQIGTVQTAEEVLILNDALKWRELQASKSNAQKKAEGARPVVKPTAKRAASAAKASNAKKSKATMNKSGSIDDVTNWLLS